MTQKRAGLNFDEGSIDIEEFAEGSEEASHSDESLKEALDKSGEETGFVSRTSGVLTRIERRRTPYIMQKNVKMRLGMPEILAEITYKLRTSSDQETIELAIGALLEKAELKKLKAKYNKLTK